MINETDYVDLGLACAEVCTALGWGMGGKKLKDLSQSVSNAIGQLTTWVEPEIYILDNPLTTLLITELRRRSERRSSSGVGGMRSPNFSTPRTIGKLSPPGEKTSSGSFKSSMYVQLHLLWHR